MDAPLYLPATAFERPDPAPYEMDIDGLTVSDVLTSPVVLVILNEEIPGFEQMGRAPSLQAYAGAFTIRNIAALAGWAPDATARIDARIRALPASDRIGP